MGWSEKLIEPCNSWFSPKELSGLRRMFPLGVEHWKVSIGRKATTPIKLRIPEIKNTAVRLWGRSSIGQKGNSPRSPVKVPKYMLSELKEVRFLRQ